MRLRRINHEGFAAVLPVAEGAEDAVREMLVGLPRGSQSPFASLPGTHFARLVLLQFRDRHERALDGVPRCLFFAAEFDMFVHSYLGALCTRMGDQADAIFGHCPGYPGAAGPPAFTRWMLDHRVRPGFSVLGNPRGTADEIARSLELRERIIAFAVKTRHLEPSALSKRWAQQDWEVTP
jgi:hypothetical protein